MRSKNQKNFRKTLRETTCLMGGLFVFSAFAAETVMAQTILDEIVVTAQKRAENLQDVPVSVTAFSGEALKDLGFEDSTSLASQVPNFTFGTPVGEGNNPGFTLRGVGLNDFGDGNEAPIAMYVDEVYIGTLAGQTIQLFDMERIEVLRGPQGTLYGRNATGGLVHFITAKPTEELQGYADLTIAEHGQIRMEAAASGALHEKVRARISGVRHVDNGFVTNRLNSDHDANNTDYYAGRLQLEFLPTEQLSLLLNGHFGKVDQNAADYDHVGLLDENFEMCAMDAILADQCQDVTGYRDADGDIYTGSYDRQSFLRVDTYGFSGKLEYAGEEVEVVSVTAYENVDKLHQEDTDMGPSNYLEPTFGVESEQFSQEVRVSGSTDQFKWVIGGYYYTDSKDGQADLLVNNALDQFLVDVGAAPPADVVPVLLDYKGVYSIDTDSYAIFGQLDYDFSEKLAGTLGLRYTDESKEFFFNSVIDGGPGPSTDATTGDDKTDYSAVSGKVGLTYRPSEDLMIFANAARGFKSGGYNGTFLFDLEGLRPYNKETLTSYELGFKSTFADGAVRFNATAFFYDYEDMQALLNVVFEGGGGATSVLLNLDQVDVYGVEAELIAQPFEGFEVVLGAGLIDSEIKEAPAGNEAFIGNELAFAPNFNANGVFRYFHTIGTGGTMNYQVDFTYTGDQWYSIDNDPLLSQDGYALVNARISYTSADDMWQVAAFVNNLFDKEYTTYKFPFFEDGFYQQMIGHPQWFGAQFSIRFN
ncbi:TonB-dependent receptor [Luteithermobacter gelatinilyticus]|uniref:TonB-dependent receptor n=1 Tax=Luteithermobacter gelatinilyticus TaxID=2582913 RepID=UPI001106BE69|nr:TonB-dependent receptor [Luteithermobacter gelatinilyticus]